MRVGKLKDTAEGPVEFLRFIRIFWRINDYLRRLKGASHTLPYLGRCSLIILGDGEVLCTDSADIEGCSNMFKLPPQWHPYFYFEKAVSASLVGGNPQEMIYLAMAVLHMGLIFAVDLMQYVTRSLVSITAA